MSKIIRILENNMPTSVTDNSDEDEIIELELENEIDNFDNVDFFLNLDSLKTPLNKVDEYAVF